MNPVNIPDKNINVTKSASNFGNRQRSISHLIIGAIMKYKKIEKTNGTKIVFIEYNAKVIPIALSVIKLAGIMLSLKGVIPEFYHLI